MGQGFDVHRFSDDPERVLILGGVRHEGHRGLVGHSDGDALAHACADALLGAVGMGDIGSWFPDDDPRHEGADSIDLLATVAQAVADAGWLVANIDTSVVCETPRIAPRRADMQQRLAEAVSAPVSVKGRRAEGLGAIGRSEGVCVYAAALLMRSEVAPVDRPGMVTQ